MSLLLLLACLPTAQTAEEEHAVRPLKASDPRWSQPELITLQAPFWTGRLLRGDCAGPVLAEATDGNEQLTFASLGETGAYVLFLPGLSAYALRYGCDEDDDGMVLPEAIAVLNLTEPSQRRVDLVVPAARPQAQIVLLSPDRAGGGAVEKKLPPPGMEPLDQKDPKTPSQPPGGPVGVPAQPPPRP